MDLLQRARDILSTMTLEEKVGQMVLTHLTKENMPDKLEAVRQGKIGAYLTYEDNVEVHTAMKQASRESRTGIPVIFGKDVIHGHWTVFPVGIGIAASFNPELTEEIFRIIAQEASASAVDWTFTPMLDIARDPRWGRISEGFGEDPYLASRLAEASVWGLQGKNPEEVLERDRILACPKHFIGYGAAEGGRDANTIEISQYTLYNIYFPPFLAAMQAGAGSIMSGYHDLNGEPVSASKYILTRLAKEQGGLQGFIVSDYCTTEHLCKYRFAQDKKEAAKKAANSGLDMDMCSDSFRNYLVELVQEGAVPEEQIDDAVLRILHMKLRLDLWNRTGESTAEGKTYEIPPAYFEKAIEAAVQGSVLLHNPAQTLPLSKEIKTLYVTGPLADAKRELLGTWCLDGLQRCTPSLLDALKAKLPDTDIRYEDVNSMDRFMRFLDEDRTVVYVGGEIPERNGELNGVALLELPAGQEEQIISLWKRGFKVVLVVVAGRPMALANLLPYVSAVLYVFTTGTGGGEATARILLGEEEPSGRLPVTFPYAVGQVPIYYNSIQMHEDRPMHLRYLDLTHKPLYPFGYGLTYTTFAVSDITAESKGNKVEVSVNLRNTGERAGTAVIQCYIRDCIASLLRPNQELKGFRRVYLQPNETARVRFTLTEAELGFFNQNGEWMIEPGEFQVFVGTDAQTTIDTKFTYTNEGEK